MMYSNRQQPVFQNFGAPSRTAVQQRSPHMTELNTHTHKHQYTSTGTHNKHNDMRAYANTHTHTNNRYNNTRMFSTTTSKLPNSRVLSDDDEDILLQYADVRSRRSLSQSVSLTHTSSMDVLDEYNNNNNNNHSTHNNNNSILPAPAQRYDV